MKKSYLSKIEKGLNKRIAIFTSDDDISLVKEIVSSLEWSKVSIPCIITNNRSSKVIEYSKEQNIRLFIVDDKVNIHRQLKLLKIDLVVLAHFNLKMTKEILDSFRVLDSHQSIYMDKFNSFYGIEIHKEVIERKEKFSGFTFYCVNDNKELFRKELAIYRHWKPEDLMREVNKAEKSWFTQIIKETVYEKR